MAPSIFGDRLFEIGSAKIGPVFAGDHDLRVAALPEEKVGEAELSRGADQEIGVRDVGGVEVVGEELSVDLLGIDQTLIAPKATLEQLAANPTEEKVGELFMNWQRELMEEAIAALLAED